MRKSLFLIAILFPIVFVFLGCPQPSGNGEDGYVSLSFVDIVNAKAIIVGPSTMVKSKTSSNVLMKFTSSNELELVKCRDENGDLVEIDPPSAIYMAGAYLILVFDRPYLVNRSTGATYDLSPAGTPTPIFTDTGASGLMRKSVYWDSSWNIFYLVGGMVKKINVTDPNGITAENYTPDVDNAEDFAVDLSGNVIYKYFGGKRLKKSNGGLYNLENNMYAFWTGLDGTFYDVWNDGYIKNITVDDTFNVSITNKANPSAITLYQCYQFHWLYFDDRIIIICDNPNFELDNPTHTPRRFDFSFLAFDSRKIIKYSENYYYVATKSGEIIRVNPVDDSYSTLLPPNDYDIYKMTVCSDDNVVFNALRMSDGKKVLARVSPTGTLEILDETLASDVVILERLD